MKKTKPINIEKQTQKSINELNKLLRGFQLKPIEKRDLKSIKGFLNTLKNGFDIEKELFITNFFDYKDGNLFLLLANDFDNYIKVKRESITKGLIEFLYTEKTDLGKYKIIKKRGKKK